jgi:anti-anti-sigma factor
MTDPVDDSHEAPAERVRDLGPLELRSARDGDVHTITLTGELDLHSKVGVEQELRRVEDADAAVIRLDLTSVTFIDSTGIGLLLGATTRSREKGVRLEIDRPPDSVMRLLTVAGVIRLLPFVD